MKKHILLISIFVGVLFTGCKWGVEKKEAKNGLVSLNITKVNTYYSNSDAEARTIGAAPDWKLGDISNWNVCFIDTANNEINKTINERNNTVLIPYGNYKVKVTGVSSTDPSYTLYGETDLQLESPTAELAVIVSVLQTSEGHGTFEYTLKLSNLTLSDGFGLSDEEISAFVTLADSKPLDEYEFTAKLTSTSNAENTVNLQIAGGYESGVIVLTIKNAEGNPISSGFYYLTVICTYKGQSYAIPLYDSLVEIDDDLLTKGSYDDSDFTGIIVKNIYTSNNPDDEYNGLIASNPKYFNDTINWLADNKGKWIVANIYFVEQEIEDDDSYYEYAGKVAPKYNIQNKNPTSNGDGRRIDVYAGETMIYTLENGKIILKSGAEILYFENDASNPAPAPDSLVISFDKEIMDMNFVLDNVSLPLVGDDTWKNGGPFDNPRISVCIDKTNTGKYSLTESPLITIKYPGPCNLTNNPVLYDSSVNYDSDDVMEGYVVLTKSEETASSFTTKLYVSPSGTAAVNVTSKIPSISILGSSEVYTDSMTSIEYSIAVNEGESFVSGKTYTYTWFLNGMDISTNASTDESVSVDSTTHAITIDFTKNFHAKIGDNNLLLVVTCDDEIVSVAKKITIKKLISAIYQGRSLYAVDLSDDAYKGEVSGLNKVSSSFSDFAVDKEGYLYVASESSYNDGVSHEVFSVYRYKDITSSTSELIAEEDIDGDSGNFSGFKLYYDSYKDILYYGYYADVSPSKIYIKAISDISTKGVKPTATSYSFSASGFYSLYDFAVYTNGETKTLYLITKGSGDEYPKIYYTSDLNTAPTATASIDVYGEDTYSEYARSYNKITDITIVGNYVYALLCERGNIDDETISTGAVAKISIENNSIFGEYGRGTFCGPTKIIAIKQKELIITDDGAYFERDGVAPDVNQVTTFNLEELTITGTDVESQLSVYVHSDDLSNASNFGYFYFKDVE